MRGQFTSFTDVLHFFFTIILRPALCRQTPASEFVRLFGLPVPPAHRRVVIPAPWRTTRLAQNAYGVDARARSGSALKSNVHVTLDIVSVWMDNKVSCSENPVKHVTLWLSIGVKQVPCKCLRFDTLVLNNVAMHDNWLFIIYTFRNNKSDVQLAY